MTRLLPAVLIVLVGACGLPTQESVDLAQTVSEMGIAVQEMSNAQADLQAHVDSLGQLVARQDSTIRNLANLLGAPLPSR